MFLRTASRTTNTSSSVVVAIAVWRVNDFPKLVENTRYDLRFVTGTITRDEHLARYGDRSTRKYSAQAIDELGRFLRGQQPTRRYGVRVWLFVRSVREGRTNQRLAFLLEPARHRWIQRGPPWLRRQRTARRPPPHDPGHRRASAARLVPDVDDSAHFFMSTPTLAGWLLDDYQKARGPEGFDVWIRKALAP